MLDTIKPFYSSRNVCLENLYTSICEALNRKISNIYAYSWNFGYSQINENFARKIKVSRDGQVINTEQSYILEKYCGITPIWHMNCDMKYFKEIVRKELDEGRVVGLGIDIYSCSWHIFYQKYHFTHFCLIVDMDENGFICIDDTLDSHDGVLNLSNRPDHVKIDYETYSEYKAGFLTFDIIYPEPKISYSELIYRSVLKTLTGYNGMSDYDQMRNLISDFEKNFNIDQEAGVVSDIRAVEIIRTFGCVSWSRNNYGVFLEGIKERVDFDLLFITDQIKKSAVLWDEIKNYILKYSVAEFREDFDNTLVCNHIKNIIAIEEELAKSIVLHYEKHI